MAEIKQVEPRTTTTNEPVRSQDFWSRYSKPILYGTLALLLIVGGYFAYKQFIQKPNELKAADAIAKAEEYFRADSLQLALNGDGINPGFLKVISNYGGTKAGNLARFYAGSAYLNLGDNTAAAKHLDDFETDSKPIQARAYKLLADAYAGQGKNAEALANYKKAAEHFEDDEQNASQYLFMAAYFASRVMNNKEEAIELFKELKEEYPATQFGFEADKYLAQLGVLSTDKK